jgi:hypothetical protein
MSTRFDRATPGEYFSLAAGRVSLFKGDLGIGVDL